MSKDEKTEQVERREMAAGGAGLLQQTAFLVNVKTAFDIARTTVTAVPTACIELGLACLVAVAAGRFILKRSPN